MADPLFFEVSNETFYAEFSIIVALIGCTDKEESTTKTATEKLVAMDVRVGKAFAERECKGCHGLDGRGAAPGIPHLAAQRERYLLAAINCLPRRKACSCRPQADGGRHE